MKTNTLFLSLLAGLAFGMVSLTSCSNDDDDNNKKKDMKFQDASDVIDLSKLADGYVYTIKDGSVLTDTLDNKGIGLFIAEGATVTLDNAVIKGTNGESYDWGGLHCKGDATIILKEGTTNYVRGFYTQYPGIYVPENHTVVIKGDGALTACSNGDGAGIGGGFFKPSGNVEIQGGNITANGGTWAAGIGGGNGASCGNITISGGNIIAQGGKSGAGIGSGTDTSCGEIVISGGTVTATGGDKYDDRDSYGAGIGCGGFRNEAGSTSTACKKIIIQNTVTSVSATKVPGCVNSVGRSTKETKCGQIVIGGTMYWDAVNYVNGGENYLTKSTMVYEPEK